MLYEYDEWSRQRGNWRLRQEVEKDPLLDSCQGKVLSPKNDSEEEREKLKSRKMFLKARKLTESWSLAKECRKFLEDNTKGWMKRT